MSKRPLTLERYQHISKNKILSPHTSVTEYLLALSSETEADIKKNYPEVHDEKVINYYIFGKKNESYLKNGKTVTYSRTCRMDMMHPVCEIGKELIDAKNNYLVHRSHVDNIAIVFPVIKEAFEGKFIELDFSENLAMKPKHDVQSAHFSSKQYALHVLLLKLNHLKESITTTFRTILHTIHRM